MDVSTTKNHSKKNWFLQSCDSCDQRNEKMEDRMISSFESTGLVFIVPYRHDKPKPEGWSLKNLLWASARSKIHEKITRTHATSHM